MTKRTFLIGFICAFLFSFSAQQQVYICKGSNSKRYHKSEDCRGLTKCSTKIYKVSVGEAKELGRTPCKIEY